MNVKPSIRNITISGRIGSGASTLAAKLGKSLGWQVLEGGQLFRKLQKEKGFDINSSNSRPDDFDLKYEEMVENKLRNEKNQIIQSHLAGFDARGIGGVFKILVICEDTEGNDKTEIRVDRVVNRDGTSIEEAKKEVLQREKEHLTKFRRLYAGNDPRWVYWDRKYYDLVINTYSLNAEEALKKTLEEIKE